MTAAAPAAGALAVGTSWKMNKTRLQAAEWIAAVAGSLPDPAAAQVFVIPPFTAIGAAVDAVGDLPILVGAQNVHEQRAGAYTGEISAPMLADAGCSLVEIGHSERRRLYGETDAAVALKVAAVLASSMRPLVCVGEDAAQRDAGIGVRIVLDQARRTFAAIPASQRSSCWLAYEPVWSIGEGATPATPDHIGETAAALKGEFPDVTVLYGGSVDADNAGPICAVDGVGGLFVGRAALAPAGFLAVLEGALEGRSQGSMAKVE